MDLSIKIFLVLLIGGGLIVAGAIQSEDIDETCNKDNMTLFRYNGLWQCGSLQNVIWQNVTNITNIFNNYTSTCNNSFYLNGLSSSSFLSSSSLNNYYNKSQVDSNLSNYYLATNPNGFISSYIDTWKLNYTSYYNKSQIDSNSSYLTTYNSTYDATTTQWNNNFSTLSSKANYQFGTNSFNGSGNITTYNYIAYINGTTGPAIRIDSNTSNAELLKFNIDRPWSFWQRGVGSNAILDLRSSGTQKYFQITNSAGNPIISIQAGNTGWANDNQVSIMNNTLVFYGQNIMKVTANGTAQICNSTNEGAIYYDGSTKKHYGCNSTTWGALY